ncbi:calmodulin [Trypanosoma grayi]|uniref:calmodulin n=1 Tax=Trypanosoma grayi TaxID=71804 RepID=UPI0004F44442|nr:calmodulin [Trypanosoma grayi]KEG13720.1 calmodulin [Trypanosoma grayi]
MSATILHDVSGEATTAAAAGDIFNALHVLAPDGEAYIPPFFIMTAAREMGYYPTAQQLQSSLSEVVGRGDRLTLPLFMQLCALLESTRALDSDTIHLYKRAFDVRNTGVLNRGEFRTIIATSAATDISSSEIEAIVELLDPIHTDSIQLHALQSILMRYLSKDSKNVRESSYTPRSARKEPVPAMVASSVWDDNHLKPRSLNVNEFNRKPLSSVPRKSKSSKSMERVPVGAIPNSVHEGYHSCSTRTEADAAERRHASPFASAPDDMTDSRGEPSPGFPPPQTTAPSPYTSGPVTRATSLQQNMQPREPLLQPKSMTTPLQPSRGGSANEPPCVVDTAEKPSVRMSERSRHSATPPSHVPYTLMPFVDACPEGTELQAEDASLQLGSAQNGAGSTRRTPPEPTPEELRDIPLDDTCSAHDMSGGLLSQGDDATPEGSTLPRIICAPTNVAIEDGACMGQGKARPKVFCDNCCQMF